MPRIEVGDATLYLGDCLDVLPTLGAASCGLILCDMPYGATAAKFDKRLDLEVLWPLLWRVAAPSCPIVLTATQPFSSMLTLSQLDRFKYEWVWIKNRGSNFANTGREPMKEHEHVLVFARKASTYNRQMQDRTGGGLSRVQYKVDHLTKSENYGAFASLRDRRMPDQRVPSSWQKFNIETGHHPQQKPVELCRYLIRTHSNPGDMVLDFTCGSGTTGVAAILEGRKFCGIEREQKFVDIARTRIEKALTLPK